MEKNCGMIERATRQGTVEKVAALASCNAIELI